MFTEKTRKPKSTPPSKAQTTSTERRDTSSHKWHAANRQFSQDVFEEYSKEFTRGPLNPARRAAGESSFLTFCDNYGSVPFFLPWSVNHIQAVARIEAAARHGEMFAFAMPRGSGKTTLARWGAMWAVLYGHSPYVVLISATMSAAERQLKNLKATFRFNDEFFEDFPEAGCPIRHIKGEARRCSGQKYKGEPTGIEWSKSQIVFATIPVPYARCSGAIIDVTGMEADIRGRQFERRDGTIVRPTFVISDDPQTRDSARSPSQCIQREQILAGDVKYMAGPDRPLGMVIPCTVICRDDLADRLLDRKTHPELQGAKTRMLDSFPTDEKKWEEYGRLRKESYENGGKGEEADAFYAADQVAMDAGAIATWPERMFPGELSAIQHALNLKILNEAAFFAEYQNEPMLSQVDEITLPTVDEIAARVNGVARQIVPNECTKLTAFIDLSEKVLWWAVCGWRSDGFTGAVLDYGVYPRPMQDHVTLATVGVTLTVAMHACGASDNAGLEAAWRWGLESLCDSILGREWKNESGGSLRVNRCLVDCNYAKSTDVVEQFCRRSKHAAILFPSRGRGVTAGKRPLNDIAAKKKPGEIRGKHWRITRESDKGSAAAYDTNFWKSFVLERWNTAVGDSGALTLFQAKPHQHRMFAEQVTTEYYVRTEGYGRVVDQWQIKPGETDNHFFDCLVGCSVAASMEGVRLKGDESAISMKNRRPSVKISELKRQ